jgi:hypothetical protein
LSYKDWKAVSVKESISKFHLFEVV